MNKCIAKFAIGLIVVFVAAVALPMVAQGQPMPTVSNCKYVGPADPLALNSVAWGSGTNTGYVNTVKAQKEIFYCYATAKDVPDDKTLADPMANRDKITKGLKYIVEIEIFAFIAEVITGGSPTVEVRKTFQVTRCVKELRTAPPGTVINTWVVAGCEYYGDNNVSSSSATYMGPVPAIPATAARQCATFGKSPYTGGPIPVEDPMEMNTVLVDYDNDGEAEWIKTIKVNKEVFRCFTSGSPDAPAIYDIELYTEEIQTATASAPGFTFPVVYKEFEVAYCAKKEKEAILLGCSFKTPGQIPFGPTVGGLLPAELRPFLTLQSAGVRQSAGKFSFEAQGTNIESVQVHVYDTSGRLVSTIENSGNRLSWNGLNRNGQRLANGVYLYVMTVQGTYGDLVRTKVQKFAVLR